MSTTITKADLYQRQITLIGEKNQLKIQNSKILVVGSGGLGCPALMYLATAGVGEIGIIDFDVVSVSNLQRQVLFTFEDIGLNKAEVATLKLSKLAPLSKFVSYPFQLNSTNASHLIKNYDIILDCTDNFKTKFLIHDVCFVEKKTLVQASVYQSEGQLQVFTPEGPCLRCLWTKEPEDGCTQTCAEIGVWGPLVGVLGSMQAMEALKILTNSQHLKSGETLFVDLINHSMDKRTWVKNDECLFCKNPIIKMNEVLVIEHLSDLTDFELIDVRELSETMNSPLLTSLNAQNIPFSEIDSFNPQMNKKYVAICSMGIRSQKAASFLKEKEPSSTFYSFLGGVSRLECLGKALRP